MGRPHPILELVGQRNSHFILREKGSNSSRTVLQVTHSNKLWLLCEKGLERGEG